MTVAGVSYFVGGGKSGLQMDRSPQISPEAANRNTVVASVMPFLSQQAVDALRSTSRGYGTSITSVNAASTRLFQKRRVEEEVGFPIVSTTASSQEAERKQDWGLTYEILKSGVLRPTLWLTGSTIDQEIATKLSIPKPSEDQLVGATMIAYDKYPEVFKVLFPRGWIQATDADKRRFITLSFQVGDLAILDNPMMLDYIKSLDQATVSGLLTHVFGVVSSPIALDFFLSATAADVNPVVSPDNIFFIIEGSDFATAAVLMKHGIINPFETINDEGQIAPMDLDFSYQWTPLWIAGKMGRIEMVRLFVEYLPDGEDEPYDFGEQNFDLGAAIRAGYTEVITILLETGFVVMEDNYLRLAIQHGYAAMVRILLPLTKFDVGDLDPDEMPLPMMIQSAFTNNRTEIALVLLADPRTVLTIKKKSKLLALARYYNNHRLETVVRLRDN